MNTKTTQLKSSRELLPRLFKMRVQLDQPTFFLAVVSGYLENFNELLPRLLKYYIRSGQVSPFEHSNPFPKPIFKSHIDTKPSKGGNKLN